VESDGKKFSALQQSCSSGCSDSSARRAAVGAQDKTQLTGHWNFNQDQSDDSQAKGQDAQQNSKIHKHCSGGGIPVAEVIHNGVGMGRGGMVEWVMAGWGMGGMVVAAGPRGRQAMWNSTAEWTASGESKFLR